MTAVPQDVRSPIQQSRWIRAYATSTIPAHAVCEVSSNSIGTDGTETLTVKQPSAKGLPECVINGPVPIESGKYGWVTYDLPAYALGSGLTVGDMAGTQSGSFSLSKGFPGFMVLGDGPSGTVRVKPLWEPLVRATLQYELCPDAANADIATSWVSRNDLGIETAGNTYKLAGEAGADVALQWDGKSQKWIVLQVEHRMQELLTDIVKATCKIDKKSIVKTSLMYCGSEVQQTAVQFYQKTFLTDLGLYSSTSGSGSAVTGDCELATNSMTVCVFDDAANNGLVTKVSFQPRVVMTTLRQNNLCLEGYIQTIYVPCASDGEYVNMVCGTSCASGSSG